MTFSAKSTSLLNYISGLGGGGGTILPTTSAQKTSDLSDNMELLYADETLDPVHPGPRENNPQLRVVVNVRRVQKTFWMMTDFRNPQGIPMMPADAERWTHLPPGVRYLTWQLEECPETERLHLQCYVELTRTRSLQWMKTNISPSADFQWRRGTQAQAVAYVTKVDTRRLGPFSLGTKSLGQGSRTDLIALRESVKQLMTTREINEIHCITLARYTKYYQLTKNLYRPPYDRDMPFKVTLNIGEPGCGKTKYVYDKWGNDEDFYEVAITNNTLWFDGYDRQKYVLFDDFCGKLSHVRLDTALKLFDRYPRMVPIKGGYEWWMPHEIEVTINIHPRQWYTWDEREVQYAALKRRFTGGVFTWVDDERVLVDEDFWERAVANYTVISTRMIN